MDRELARKAGLSIVEVGQREREYGHIGKPSKPAKYESGSRKR
jgi:hypothetical protein